MKRALLVLLLALPGSAQLPMRPASAASEAVKTACPELAGLNRVQAEQRLRSLQLSWQVCEVESSAAENQVVGQSPPAGQPVSGSVLLYLARPQSAPAQPVPKPTLPAAPTDSRWLFFVLAQIPLAIWGIHLGRGRRES